MCASSLSFFRADPPPPRVALLPDGLFFVRSVAVTPGATAAEAATQVELALEAVSPFPLAQLYFGWFWVPGAEHALVFAAYRRRFTTEQTAGWDQAEMVLPGFVAVLGGKFGPATTVLLRAPEGLTMIHWEKTQVPSSVVFHPIAAEASEEEWARGRDAALRSCEGSRKVIELAAPLLPQPVGTDGELAFRSGDFVSHLPAPVAAALDVRDKGDLAVLRGARRRDVLLWRVALGCAAAILLLGVGEFALMGGRAWQKVRTQQYNSQKPLVERIASEHELTTRIEDLSTKVLLPLEMVGQLVGENLERRPEGIQFTKVQADTSRGLHTIFVEGKTNNASQVNAYEATLKALPAVQTAEAKFLQITGERATFALTVTFKADALKPTVAAVAATP